MSQQELKQFIQSATEVLEDLQGLVSQAPDDERYEFIKAASLLRDSIGWMKKELK